MTDRSIRGRMVVFALCVWFAAPSLALTAEDARLAQRLQHGGYVLVMRHAEAPSTEPSPGTAEADNPRHERQLDATGKRSAQALGAALRALHIPIGPIYSSPLYRARETLRLAGLPTGQAVPELTEGPHGMAATAAQAQDRWLRWAVRRTPPAGSNTLIVTHTPNIVGAFGKDVADVHAAEMLVFDPHAPQRPSGRLRLDQWQARSH